eukprot:scaffold10970_cov83-Skeletonema_dohrnii-CCMP3373.AAC.1
MTAARATSSASPPAAICSLQLIVSSQRLGWVTSHGSWSCYFMKAVCRVEVCDERQLEVSYRDKHLSSICQITALAEPLDALERVAWGGGDSLGTQDAKVVIKNEL